MRRIGITSQGNTHYGVEESKTESGKKAELGIGNTQLGNKLRANHGKQSAIDKVHNIDQR